MFSGVESKPSCSSGREDQLLKKIGELTVEERNANNCLCGRLSYVTTADAGRGIGAPLLAERRQTCSRCSRTSSCPPIKLKSGGVSRAEPKRRSFGDAAGKTDRGVPSYVP